MSLRDFIALAVVLFALGLLGKYVVPAEYQRFYIAVVIIVAVIWLLTKFVNINAPLF